MSGIGTRAAGIGLSDLIQQVYINVCMNFNAGDAISAPDKIYIYKEDKNSPSLKIVMDNDRTLPAAVKIGVHFLAIDEGRKFFHPFTWKGTSLATQKLLQIWMAGNHTDVGGGYQDDFLSAISLHGMLEIILQETSLKVDQSRFDELIKKIRSEDVQDKKKWIHDERRLLKVRLLFMRRSLVNRWRRSNYMETIDFVQESKNIGREFRDEMGRTFSI